MLGTRRRRKLEAVVDMYVSLLGGGGLSPLSLADNAVNQDNRVYTDVATVGARAAAYVKLSSIRVRGWSAAVFGRAIWLERSRKGSPLLEAVFIRHAHPLVVTQLRVRSHSVRGWRPS